MFDDHEMPQEHFHQFISSSRQPPPPPQLPPSIFSSTTVNFPPFDHHHPNYPSHLHLHSQLLLHQLHHKNDDQDHQSQSQGQMISSGLELERDDLWTNEEVLELLRIRSNMENWFPDFTWNHVSRKLAEVGFKRSPEKCKEKFEEESQHLNNNITYTKNYRFFSELEEICHVDQNPPLEEEEDDDDPSEENAQHQEDKRNQTKGQKRKRSSSKKKKFEKLKQFCEEIVNKMMIQQEELNNKLIQDMLKRDEENLAKEEAWKKQETERINKEIESRAKEHAIAKERQAKIIEFLNKFTSNSQNNKLEAAASSSSTGPNTEKDLDSSKRWPRDEVLALINLRSNHHRDEKEGLARGPLWERISKGMMELSYKRSAKRCKEKWENINKYYRKTKDANKKRSVDSRTCPYFHQLSTLYNQTTLGQTHHGNGAINGDYYDDHDDDEEDHIGL